MDGDSAQPATSAEHPPDSPADSDPEQRAAPDVLLSRCRSVAVIGLWAASMAFIAVAAIYMVPVRDADIDGLGTLQPSDVVDMILNFTIVTLGALIVLRSRSPRYGWVMLGVGVANTVAEAAGEFALYGWYVEDARGSFAVDAAIWLQDNLGLARLAAIVLVLPSLFPDGHPVGRWRRPVRWLTALWAVWWAVPTAAFATPNGQSAHHGDPDR